MRRQIVVEDQLDAARDAVADENSSPELHRRYAQGVADALAWVLEWEDEPPVDHT